MWYNIFIVGDNVKFIKRLVVFIIAVVVIFLSVESLRLELTKSTIPLIIISKTECSREIRTCYDENGLYKETFKSFGFTFTCTYSLLDISTDNMVFYELAGREFKLLGKYKIWEEHNIEQTSGKDIKSE